KTSNRQALVAFGSNVATARGYAFRGVPRAPQRRNRTKNAVSRATGLGASCSGPKGDLRNEGRRGDWAMRAQRKSLRGAFMRATTKAIHAASALLLSCALAAPASA